jgi:hypothetical protein
VLLLLGALAGCMTIDGDLRVDPDETVSGTFIVAVERTALVASKTSEEKFLSQMDRWNANLTIPASGQARVERYVTDELVGKRYVYTKVPLHDFNVEGGWRIKHDGHWYVVDGEVDFSGVADQPGIDPEAISKGWNVTVRITFPGEVQFANGEIDRRTVTWRPVYGHKTSLTAGAEDQPPSGFTMPDLRKFSGPALLLLIAGAVGEVLVVTVAALLVRRRRAQAQGRQAAPVRGRRALVRGAPARPEQVLVGTIIERSQYERAGSGRAALESANGSRQRGAHRQSR